MSLNIDKTEMDQAWKDRNKSDQLYKYLYAIAKHQVAKKGINYSDRDDYIQFAIFKCFKHQESYSLKKGRAYSFFWKQISLAIAYKLRKIKRRKDKVVTIFVEEEKLLDWADNIQQETEGIPFKDIVDEEELKLLKSTYKKYNYCHKSRKLKPSKKSVIKVIKWAIKSDKEFLNNFTTLKRIFSNWLEVPKASK